MIKSTNSFAYVNLFVTRRNTKRENARIRMIVKLCKFNCSKGIIIICCKEFSLSEYAGSSSRSHGPINDR